MDDEIYERRLGKKDRDGLTLRRRVLRRGWVVIVGLRRKSAPLILCRSSWLTVGNKGVLEGIYG